MSIREKAIERLAKKRNDLFHASVVNIREKWQKRDWRLSPTLSLTLTLTLTLEMMREERERRKEGCNQSFA